MAMCKCLNTSVHGVAQTGDQGFGMQGRDHSCRLERPREALGKRVTALPVGRASWLTSNSRKMSMGHLPGTPKLKK